MFGAELIRNVCRLVLNDRCSYVELVREKKPKIALTIIRSGEQSRGVS